MIVSCSIEPFYVETAFQWTQTEIYYHPISALLRTIIIHKYQLVIIHPAHASSQGKVDI